uniref:hypothetical protein n=1 Tax=Klebsiella aerogenes TaxID=548 RepID=UPI0013D84032
SLAPSSVALAMGSVIIHNEIKTKLSDILLLQSFKKPCKIACLLEKNQLVLKEIKRAQKVKLE